MNPPVKELAIGLPDGVTTDFQTRIPYVSGTVVPFINGQALPEDVIEVDSWLIFRLEYAPKVGDTISVYYVPKV